MLFNTIGDYTTYCSLANLKSDGYTGDESNGCSSDASTDTSINEPDTSTDEPETDFVIKLRVHPACHSLL